jgi:acyl-CoA thioesterase
MTSELDRAISLTEVSANRFGARVPEGWLGSGRAQGGLLAAQVLAAMTRTVDDPTRAARSITVHMLSAPDAAAPYEIETTVERTGRSVVNLSARILQDGRPLVMGLGLFSTDRHGPDLDELPMPEVNPATPGRVTETYVPEFAHPFAERMVLQHRTGPEAFSSPEGPMTTGGWIGFSDPRPVDEPGLLVMGDAGIMPWWVRLPEMRPTATVDYTMHFRAPFPRTDPDELVYAGMQTRLVRGGFLDWDAVLWAPDGTVLCLARQQLVTIG